jgi:hypothetical protein
LTVVRSFCLFTDDIFSVLENMQALISSAKRQKGFTIPVIPIYN